MDDGSNSLKPWATFAGGVLVIVVLYWAQAVLVPVALAVLLSFVLAPPVNWLQRWLGRVPAVLVAVTLVFALMGLAGWGLAQQATSLAEDLPRYRANILAKIADVRGAGKGGAVEKLQKTIEDIKTDLEKSDAPKGRAPQPVLVTSDLGADFPGFAWLTPIMGPLGTAGLVVALVIFMLLERRELRDRLIGLFGQGHLTVTTKAFDEAGRRVSRQLLMQTLVSCVYGIVAGVGLYLLGVPYPLVWGVLGAVLRYIPYVGPVLGAGAPILVSLAALPSWVDSLWVVAFFHRARGVHEPRARDRVVCGGSRGHLTSRAARLSGVLDMVVGAARTADGDAADRVFRRARQTRTGSGVCREIDGRYARTCAGVRVLPATAGPRSE